MPGQHDRPFSVTVERLACALLEVAAIAWWPGGPLLLDLDSAVLREHLAPQLFAAVIVAGSNAYIPPAHRSGPGWPATAHGPPRRTGAAMLTPAQAPALPLVTPPLHGRLYESCRLHRARLVVSWPDAQFEVCLDCVPAPLLSEAPTGSGNHPAHASPTRNPMVVAWWRCVSLRPSAGVPAAAHLPSARAVRHS